MQPNAKSEAQARLRRIAGQVGGVQRMLEEDRYCVDVLLQVAAIQAALMETGKVILSAHIDTCLTEAMKTGEESERRKKINELVDVFARFWRTRGEEEPEPSGPSSPRAKPAVRKR